MDTVVGGRRACGGGGILLVLNRWAGLCNEQAQVIILAITAGVGAGYAAVTREMARAARDNARTSREHFEATCCPKLVAYLPRYAHKGKNGCVCRVDNYSRGAATNVRLLPLWDTVKKDDVLKLGEVPKEWESKTMPEENARGRALVLPGQACGEVVVTRPDNKWLDTKKEEDSSRAVICVRWDDPAQSTRFWKCWALEPEGTRHKRCLLTAPRDGWGCKNCDEKIGDECPHTVSPAERAELFGRED